MRITGVYFLTLRQDQELFCVRLEEDVERRVEVFLKKNAIRFPQLVNLALEKFISEPQVITFEPVDSAEFMNAAKKAYKKHRSAVDKLK